MNFTKFVLKEIKEIYRLLKDKKNLGIIFCKECYKEYSSSIHYECLEIIKTVGNKDIKCLPVNFLCNDYLNKDKILSFVKNIDTICIASCGIGAQFVADIVEKRSYCFS